MTQAIESFISQQAVAGAGAEWLDRLRSRGVERFNALGIPTTRDEDWKYTNLRALASKQYAISADAAATCW